MRREPSFQGLKQPDVKRNSPSSTVQVKTMWSYAPSPPIRLHGLHRDNSVLIVKLPAVSHYPCLSFSYGCIFYKEFMRGQLDGIKVAVCIAGQCRG
jgi:hypothetical protein